MNLLTRDVNAYPTLVHEERMGGPLVSPELEHSCWRTIPVLNSAREMRLSDLPSLPGSYKANELGACIEALNLKSNKERQLWLYSV
jgi:hypothetical protein